MSSLILPRRFTSQPQQSAPINPLYAPYVVAGMNGAQPKNYFGQFPFYEGVVFPLIKYTSVINAGLTLSCDATAGTGDNALYTQFQPKQNNFTFIGVINVRNTTGGGVIVRSKGTVDTIILRRNGTAFSIRINGTDYSGGAFPLNTSLNYVLTSSPSGVYLFVNGAQIISASASASSAVTGGATTMYKDGYAGGAGDMDAALLIFLSKGISQSEARSFSNNPWQIYQAPPRRLWVVGGGAVTPILTAAWTEDTDVFSATATVTAATITASAAWAESNDTFAAASTVKVSGAASWSEASDTMSASAIQTVSASASWTDQSDTTSAAASVKLSANATWSEDSDTFSASATITAATITTSASWSESNDTFAATSAARIITAATWAEADDICAAMLTVGNGVNAAASWPEESDSFNVSATVKSSASASWSESDDVTSAIATIGNVINANVAWTEADDISSAICTVSASGAIAWIEASDVMAAAGHSDAMSTIKPNANLTAVGKPRIRSISGRQRIRSMT